MSAILTVDVSEDSSSVQVSVIAGNPIPNPPPPDDGYIRVHAIRKTSPSPALAMREIADFLQTRMKGRLVTPLENIGVNLTRQVRSWIGEIRRGNPGSTLRVEIEKEVFADA